MKKRIIQKRDKYLTIVIFRERGDDVKNNVIEVQNVKINVTNINEKDYICISDFTKFKNGKSTSDDIIRNW